MNFFNTPISVTANNSIALTVAALLTVFSVVLDGDTELTIGKLTAVLMVLFTISYAITRFIRTNSGKLTSIKRELITATIVYMGLTFVATSLTTQEAVIVRDFVLELIAISIIPIALHMLIVSLYKDKEAPDAS